jgi:hypothetical protein
MTLGVIVPKENVVAVAHILLNTIGTDDDFIKTMYLSPIGNNNSKETLEITNTISKIIHLQNAIK